MISTPKAIKSRVEKGRGTLSSTLLHCRKIQKMLPQLQLQTTVIDCISVTNSNNTLKEISTKFIG
jgi:hypothetical protein